MSECTRAFLQQRLGAVSGEGRTPVVLLSTGSLNPVHRGHLRMFHLARAELERDGRTVVLAGVLSPSANAYVRGKLPRATITAALRAQLVELAIAADPASRGWMVCDLWESEQGHFVDFPYVRRHLQDQVTRWFPGARIDVHYVCGSDHVEKCGLWDCSWVTYIARAQPNGGGGGRRHGHRGAAREVPGDVECLEHSSTKIRDLLHHRPADLLAQLQSITYDCVAERLVATQPLYLQ